MALPLYWIPRALRWIAPIRRGLQEAADQRLGKANKLQTFHEMTMEADLDELADADREAVAEFRRQKMGIGGGKGDAGNKDRIVCDDMTINNSGGGLATTLLACLAGAAGMYFLADKFKGDSPAPTPVVDAPVVVDDTEYEVRFYDKDGNLINVPRYSPPVVKE